ncbi:hypothetical protein LR48_Vigan09g269400 [Vigna angularis]|uniref:Ribosome assembly factor mrt4 n=1 Tax=Phaseolus angularis TaxID=3914 RepID=A0A0L9VG65_PHAAN|nr:hypothetical protein LR48_Vigan09g269400 [Vigna angularis]
MPKSKRNKQVTLSKTKKKGRDHKEAIVNGIKEAAEKYECVYVFSFENMRNQKFKEFREQLKSSSRFFLGSNKVMQVALGRSAADEISPGIHKVSKLLRGDAGMVFTNLSKEEVERLFKEFEEYDFARTGSLATEKRLMGIKMATFRLHLICRWSRDDFELYIDGPDESDVECS